MEKSARRRLRTLARHFGSPEIVDAHVLSPGLVISRTPSSMPVIIGGMVLDVHAKSHKDMIPGTTMPGIVRHIFGGVARNVAECMSKLGRKPFIVSVVGVDFPGEMLLSNWESIGLSTEGILKSPDATTPIVNNLFDSEGELAAGVANVKAVEEFLTREFIQQFKGIIQSAPIVMVDANMHPKSLETASRIAAESDVPVWFEPVSVAKASRISSVIKYISITSPNEAELIAMANILSPRGEFRATLPKISELKGQCVDSSFEMLKPAIHLLLEEGIKLLLVTLGPNGVFVCFRQGVDLVKHQSGDNEISNVQMQLLGELAAKSRPLQLCMGSLYAFHLPALPASVLRLTGAGDCLVGGVLTSLCGGLDVLSSVAVGIAAAKLAVESEQNVPFELPLRAVVDGALEVFSRARHLNL